MQCSGLQVAAFILLLGGTILIAISIGTSSWSKKSYNKVGADQLSAGTVTERGLWQECSHIEGTAGDSTGTTHEKCINRFEDVIKKRNEMKLSGEEIYRALSKDLKEWEIAVLALMCASALLGILSLLFTPCCCNRCGCCLASFVFFAATCCAAGICTYAYYISTAETPDDKLEEKMKQFGWSFWCAVAGGACQFLSGILFAVSRCRQHSYSHTI